MARLARLTVAGLPHLLAFRGVPGTPLFQDDADRDELLDTLRQTVRDTRLALHGYALLPDAIFLLATPSEAAAAGLAMQSLGRRYVRRFNDRHARRGSLFDGRFRSTVLEPDDWLLPCLRFVESRAVAAGLATDAAHFRWSSAAHHAGFAAGGWLDDPAAYWALGNTPFDRQAAWRDYLAASDARAEDHQIVRALMGGWALGGTSFVAELGRATARRALPGRPGRPRKPAFESVS